MKYLTLTLGLLCTSALATDKLPTGKNAEQGIFTLADVVVENYSWTGKLPKHRKIKVVNHFGNIGSRIRSMPQIGISAAIQKMGPNPAIPSFDIQETPEQTVITVVYANGQYNTDNQMIGRVDIAVVVPETISVEMETTWGDIKSKKHFSNMTAKTVSGNIKLGSVGELNAETVSGDIIIDHYNINWYNRQQLHTDQGNIELTLAKLANVTVHATGKSLASNYYQTDIQSISEQSFISFSLNQAQSTIELTAPLGHIDINLIEKPHGGYIGLPTEFSGDIRSLPTTPLWQPGDAIREQNDRHSLKDNQVPKGRGSTKLRVTQTIENKVQ